MFVGCRLFRFSESKVCSVAPGMFFKHEDYQLEVIKGVGYHTRAHINFRWAPKNKP